MPRKTDISKLPSKFERVIECKQGAVRSVRFNVDGCYCLTAGSDKSVKLWNPFTGGLLASFMGHGMEALDARGSVDNSLIASCGLDKTVMVWDVASTQCRRRLRGHMSKVTALCFNEDSSLVVSASEDGSLRVWDLRSPRANTPIQVLDDAKDSILSLDIAAHEIVCGALDETVRLYDLRAGQLKTNRLGDGVTCVSFSGDTQCLLASTAQGGLMLLDKMAGQVLAEYEGHAVSGYRVECCLPAADTHVLSGSEDGNVCCWDLISSHLAYKLPHPGAGVVHSLSPHPTKPFLLSATTGQVWLWGPTLEEA